ncbi:LacI family DNA-binding transcriptional regulator [soil metagenome]
MPDEVERNFDFGSDAGNESLADVAKLCGVTPALVVRVLKGEQTYSVTDAVRTKVVNAARKLGYVDKAIGRDDQARRRTPVIGLFLAPRARFAEGLYESQIDGVSDVLHVCRYNVFIELSSAGQDADQLASWQFDGAILMQRPKPETVAELDRRRVPYVCVNERIGNPDAFVLADDAMGMNRSIEHLAQLGHQRLAYANARATYLDHGSVTERYAAFLDGARSRGLHVVDGHNVPFASPGDFLRDAVIRQSATAIITYDHRIAVALVGAASALSLRIPEDFSLICFNDLFPVDLLPTPLTAVRVSGREMGRMGADLLLKFILTQRPRSPREIRIAEDFVVRASTAPPGSRAPARRDLIATSAAGNGSGD